MSTTLPDNFIIEDDDYEGSRLHFIRRSNRRITNRINYNESPDKVTYFHPHVERLLKIPLVPRPNPSSKKSYMTDEDTSPIQWVVDGTVLTARALRDKNNPLTLQKPIVVLDDCRKIGMRMPPPLSIRDVANHLGLEYPVTVIDISTQEESDLVQTLGDLAEYFEMSDLERTQFPILNQISLEVSGTTLQNLVRSPKFVRDLDMIDNVWPRDRKLQKDYPRVQYYCLTSSRKSYTDFHIDFGGTSVWYHVSNGLKVFLLIPPTKKNLKKYEKWLCSSDQNETFLPDLLRKKHDDDVSYSWEACSRIELEAGETLIIPTGWIHAVYTPVDSIVFGGNFLHGLGLEGQLEVHNVESRSHVQQKYKFPYFISMMFYEGAYLLQALRIEQGEPNKCSFKPKYKRLCREERKGAPALVHALKQWSLCNRVNVTSHFDSDICGKNYLNEFLDLVGSKSLKEMLSEMETRLNQTENLKVSRMRQEEEDESSVENFDMEEGRKNIVKSNSVMIYVPRNYSGNKKKSSSIRIQQKASACKDANEDEWKPVQKDMIRSHRKLNSIRKKTKNVQKKTTSLMKRKIPNVRQRLSKKLG
eukprot:CAMPEP_0116066656 /NCGR_PEP_ID=MMETSP0322-20121206/10522_1 /TAXON_ID=163516 /ORGANISM="Leptocylindrus danicus var. apora, Strain B651" /LENGTH=585 /DNA_ID=CAMNT_0003553271 /DNA_START=174 /DNA_END=1931 /DNA_ORIENTATION=-